MIQSLLFYLKYFNIVTLKLMTLQGGAFHRNAGHVLQAFIAGGRAKTPSLAFQEYHPGFPHVKHTMGYAGK